MTFPAKVFLSFLAAFALAAVALFTTALSGTRQAFAHMEARQVATALENVRRELDRGAENASRRVGLVADSEATTRMVLDLSRPQPDYSMYANDANGAARTHGLEMFEFVAGDGTVISSTGGLPPIGSKEDWVTSAATAPAEGLAILRSEAASGAPAIAQLTVRVLSVGDHKLYAVGGRPLDHRLLAALPLGPGMRALLFVNTDKKCDPQEIFDAAGTPEPPGSAAELAAQLCRNPSGGAENRLLADAAARENDYALPLRAADGTTLGAVVLGYSTAAEAAEVQALWRRLWAALALGLLAGAAISYWSAVRLVRPLVRLARSAQDIARTGGQAPGTRAEERGGPEVVALASALNHASLKLAAERDRLMQAERVAAWREMTRRVTGEIEEALDALAVARKTGDVSEGIAGFHRVLDRFRDFGELRVLPIETVRLNDVVRGVLHELEPLFHPSASDITRPPVAPEVALAEDVPALRGDLAALTRAVDTFLLYAVYSMPAGGTFVVRTERIPGFAVMRLEWPGPFPNEEEAARLFSSAPVKRAYSAGLELASAQAVISDHGGTVETARTETFSAITVRLPAAQEAHAEERAQAESRRYGTARSSIDPGAGNPAAGEPDTDRAGKVEDPGRSRGTRSASA